MKIFDLIGNTPLINLSRNIYAKLEKQNPSGSIKDRPVSYMIRNVIRHKILTKDKILLDSSSGNTGISIAMLASSLGYKSKIVMPENMSVERKKIIRAYGAEIVLTPAEKGADGAIVKVEELAKNSKYVYLNQYANGFNIKAHYETTGPEIWKQTKGNVKYVVAGMGTGGTLMGISKYLKNKNPEIKIVGVEPNGADLIQGLKNMSVNKVPAIFNQKVLDNKIVVTQKDAFASAKQLAKQGIFVGISSGAVMFVANKLAKKTDEMIVIIFPDGGEKYLSTELFS